MMKRRNTSQRIIEDKKENSEHVMLVDLARNDLSRNGHTVTVDKYSFFSHVIHLVSRVTGHLHEKSQHQ
jgi:anthranilate synthase component 1